MGDNELQFQLDAAVLAAHTQQQSAGNFASSIKKFINYVDSQLNSTFSLTNLCKDFNFQRRRFYDVINVFEALKFCQKTGVDEMIWYGRGPFKKFLSQIKNNLVQDLDSNYDQCISISGLTIRFIKYFFQSSTQTINIKDVGNYLSRENGRVTTTKCKLYQIAHILEAASVVEKTVMPGEIKLLDEYYYLDQNHTPNPTPQPPKIQQQQQQINPQIPQQINHQIPQIYNQQPTIPNIPQNHPMQQHPQQPMQAHIPPHPMQFNPAQMTYGYPPQRLPPHVATAAAVAQANKIPFTIEQLLNTPSSIKPNSSTYIDEDYFMNVV